MRTLIDTHVALWWLLDSTELADDVKDVLDTEPEVYLSPVSVWEVAIKQASGKLAGSADLPRELLASRFRELPITSAHAVRADRLPRIHGDPFDRMLIGQALCEDMVLMTRDGMIRRYEVPVHVV